MIFSIVSFPSLKSSTCKRAVIVLIETHVPKTINNFIQKKNNNNKLVDKLLKKHNMGQKGTAGRRRAPVSHASSSIGRFNTKVFNIISTIQVMREYSSSIQTFFKRKLKGKSVYYYYIPSLPG